MIRALWLLPALLALQPVAAQTPATDVRAAMPVLARHEGVWRGTFRRIDAGGKVVETFPTEITIRFPRTGPFQYEQTNRYTPAGKPEVLIKTQGTFDGERIRFENPRVRGWAADNRADPRKRGVMLFIETPADRGYMYESIVLSDDGKRRHRVAQFFAADGTLLRRTLVDEERVKLAN